jgi:RNA polymerase sigma factor (sigma-70 family)
MGESMDADTAIGGPADRFPETRQSALDQARQTDPGLRRIAYEAIVAAYWKPVYKYIRVKWREGNEGAKDLTQSFFAKALAAGTFAAYDPSRAAFRTYMRLCVDRFVWNERQYNNRNKRSAEVQSLGESCSAGGCDPEELFYREWVREIFAASVAELRAQSRPEVWSAFELYHLMEDKKPLYREVAGRLNISVTQVTNYLAAARRDLRRIVLARIRSLTCSEREYQAEVRAVLEIDP